MSNEIKLEAVSRTEFGKGAARRIRRADQVPAVMYGHGTDPVHITLPGHATLLALRTANALLSIVIDGGKAQLALPKQVQRDPIKGFIEHVDLVIVGGDDLKEGIVTTDQQSIALLVEATNIPSEIQIDVAELAVGDQIFAKDLVLPEGAVFPGEPDDLMLSIAAPISEEELEAELAAPGEGDEAAAEEASENADKADEE